MLFTSYEFIAFLVVCFIVYYILPKKCQWVVLLVASFYFYFIAGTFYPIFLIVTSLLTYLSAIWIDKKAVKDKAYLDAHKGEFDREQKKAFKKKSAKAKRRIMLFGLLSCLLILGVFKYADFMIDNINFFKVRFGNGDKLDYLNLILPMGISFYTFQSLGYLIDVYWEKIKPQKNYFKYLLFVSFFPQLVQGPISRYSDLAESLYEEHRFDTKNISFGLTRIVWGFFKKLVIADTILVALKSILSDTDYYQGVWVVVVIIFYALQLYADFSGGADITIGVAQIFGVKVEENFVRPFFSKNIAEFWRRWHITMGTWFRDYIFYPMSISDSMRDLTKNLKNKFGKGVARRVPVYLATMVTWFATGIWHGASWNFITWGVLNGVVILISEELTPLYEKFAKAFPKLRRSTGYRAFEVIRTFFLMGALRLFDCYRDVPVTFKMFGSIFTSPSFNTLKASEFLFLGLTWQQYLVVFIATVVVFIVSMIGRSGSVREKLYAKPYPVRFIVITMLVMAVLLFGSYGIGYDATQFIYNQF